MRKIYLFLMVLLLSSISSMAQTATETYLQQEDARIANANATEVAIANFITQNMSSYSLTQAKVIQTTTVQNEDGTSQVLTGQALQDALDNAKRIELRKLYFEQNPTSLNNYTANSFSQQINCVNGNFETGTTASYTFQTRQDWNHFECNTPFYGFNVLTPSTTLDNYGAYASLVTPGPDTFLATQGININKVPVNGGGFALRINKSEDNDIEEATVISRTFTADQPVFSLIFALAFENPAHPGNQNPFVRFRITDTSNGVFVERCISSTDNSGLLLDGLNKWRYMDWTCLPLNIIQFIGHIVILEIVISDCSASAHDAILYLDNICNNGSPCSGNTVGSLLLNSFNINCPNSSFNICGTYTPPSVAIGNPNLTLQIIPTSGTPITLNNAVITNNNYCFTVNPLLFGNNPQANYEINVNASFNNGTIQFSSSNSNVSGADISFINCNPASIKLDAVSVSCPTFPLTVSGSYIIPAGSTATISNIILHIINNSTGATIGIISNPTISGNTFSFPVNLTNFNFGTATPTGTFNFTVSATKNPGSTTITGITDGTTPNVSFESCCLSCPPCCVDYDNINFPIPATYSVNRQARIRIQVSSAISNNAFSSLHAGNSVVLLNGFSAKSGSRVHAYIEGCNGQYILKQSNPSNNGYITPVTATVNVPNKVELVKNEAKNIVIAPNPNKGLFKVSLYEMTAGTIEIANLLGASVYKADFIDQKEIEVNLQNQPNGIYIVKVVSKGQTFTSKLIKE